MGWLKDKYPERFLDHKEIYTFTNYEDGNDEQYSIAVDIDRDELASHMNIFIPSVNKDKSFLEQMDEFVEFLKTEDCDAERYFFGEPTYITWKDE